MATEKAETGYAEISTVTSPHICEDETTKYISSNVQTGNTEEVLFMQDAQVSLLPKLKIYGYSLLITAAIYYIYTTLCKDSTEQLNSFNFYNDVELLDILENEKLCSRDNSSVNNDYCIQYFELIRQHAHPLSYSKSIKTIENCKISFYIGDNTFLFLCKNKNDNPYIFIQRYYRDNKARLLVLKNNITLMLEQYCAISYLYHHINSEINKSLF